MQPTGKPKCARCHRPFTPKKEGQIYGPKCEKKRIGYMDLSALDHLDPTDAEGEPGRFADARLREDMAHVTPGDP